MKKILTTSLIALAFASTAAQAQDTAAPADPAAAPADATLPEDLTQDAAPATPDAVPPAADAGVTADATVTADAAAPAAAPAPAAGATAVTDAEVASYATAATKVQTIAADTALDDAAKQEQMAAAVTASGLDPARFNEISTAINTDVELRTKVQTALAAQAPGSDG
jgi:hypothetical protein